MGFSTYADFFEPEFMERPVHFSNPDSRWVLVEKVRQRYTQLLPEEVKERPYARSVVYGTFLARNMDDKSQEAIIRVIRQISYYGGEIASPEERSRQAVEKLPEYGQDMLDALTALNDAQCSSAPKLLGVSRGTQGSDDLVPGGFITWLLLEMLPGKRGGSWFWELNLQQRDHIRARFKEAWFESATVGKYLMVQGLETFYWDEATQRIAFYDFLTGCREVDEPIEWKPVHWILFGLAKAPPRYRWWGRHTAKSSTEGWEF